MKFLGTKNESFAGNSIDDMLAMQEKSDERNKLLSR